MDTLTNEFELGDDEGDGPADEVGHHDINYSRMRSIGCREEEQWKKDLWKEVPLPSEEYDSDADENSQQSDEDGLQFTGDVEGSSARACLQFSRAVADMVTIGQSDKAENVLVDIKGFRFAQNKVGR